MKFITRNLPDEEILDMNECHKCKYNGMRNEACLSCSLEETYRYPNQKYLFDGYDVPDEKSITPLEEIKPLIDEEYEDIYRKGLFDLFSLSA